VLTSLDVNDALRPELPLFQLSWPRQRAERDDEEEEVTGGGGGGGGGAGSSLSSVVNGHG
jgi:hypothetical protein